jgi:hypothetical protein
MKYKDFYTGIIQKIVKMLFLVFLSFSPSFLTFSNPIIPPSVIQEIYFGQWSWEIELCRNEFFEIENLDSLWLYGQYDTAKFEYGHEFYGDIMVVTSYTMLTPMFIDQSGDDVSLIYKNGNYEDYLGGISWGTFAQDPGWGITAPVGEQSIAYQRFDLYEYDWDYWQVKELPHSIGSNPGQVSKRTHFEGYVIDRNNEPLSGIFIDYCSYYYGSSDPDVPMIWTGPDGHFSTDNMFCRRYNISFKNGEFYEPSIGDTNVCLEPDSANFYEFKLDTLLTGIKENMPRGSGYSIFNIPNPSSSQTTFLLETNHPEPGTTGVIKIYSESGYIVDIVPVELQSEKQEILYNFNDKSLSAGVYLYNLDIGRDKMATGKMVISQ